MTFKLGPCRDPVLLTGDDGHQRAWACADCGAIYGGGSGEKTAREHCAQRICECGQALREHYTSCDACMERSGKAAERERYEKAEKIPWQRYEEDAGHAQIFSPRTDEFYPDAGTLLDCEDDPPEEPTSWAWACTVTKLHLDAPGIIEDVLSGHSEDAYINDKAQDELQGLLDAWCEKRHLQTFFPDYTRVVTFGDLVRQRLEDLGLDEDEVSEGK